MKRGDVPLLVCLAISKPSIRTDPFLKPVDVGSRETSLEVLPERIVRGSTEELGSLFQCFADALNRSPTKIGAKGIKIGGHRLDEFLGMGHAAKNRVIGVILRLADLQ